MKKPKEKSLILDEGACIFGARILLNHVQSLQEEIAGIRARKVDIEYIHRARVASRRLRSALPLFYTCLPQKKAGAWEKSIRDVTRALGEARDADVQIERLELFQKKVSEPNQRPGIQRLTMRLRQHRRRLQPVLEKALAEVTEKGVLDQMSERFSKLAARADQVYVFTPVLYQHSLRSISARLEEFLAYAPYIHQPEKITELHEMRIRAKWLRYTMETFSALYSNELKPSLQIIRKAQELLGDIHDADVWNDYLPNFIDKERRRVLEFYDHIRFFHRLVPGIEYFHQNLVQERKERYAELVDSWEKWQDMDAWENLRRSIQIPFPDTNALYPPTGPASQSTNEVPS